MTIARQRMRRGGGGRGYTHLAQVLHERVHHLVGLLLEGDGGCNEKSVSDRRRTRRARKADGLIGFMFFGKTQVHCCRVSVALSVAHLAGDGEGAVHIEEGEDPLLVGFLALGHDVVFACVWGGVRFVCQHEGGTKKKLRHKTKYKNTKYKKNFASK